MSEPVSNAEIEDVLSSIRQLVSDNSGTPRREARDEKDVSLRGRLVLTPDFRVDRDEPEAPEAEEAAPVDSLESRIAELEAAVGDSADEWEPDGSEDDEAFAESFIFQHAVADRAEPVQAAEAEAAAVPGQAEAAAAETGAGPDAAEALGPDADEPAAAPAAPFAEAEPAQAAPDSEPEAGREDEFVATAAQDWEDVAFDHVSGAEEAADADFADEAVIDEEMLRAIISRMIREELQGPMGERITQNVRRMVRREIARALAVKNLD